MYLYRNSPVLYESIRDWKPFCLSCVFFGGISEEEMTGCLGAMIETGKNIHVIESRWSCWRCGASDRDQGAKQWAWNSSYFSHLFLWTKNFPLVYILFIFVHWNFIYLGFSVLYYKLYISYSQRSFITWTFSPAGGWEYSRWPSQGRWPWGASRGGDRPAASLPATRGRLFVWHCPRGSFRPGGVPQPSAACRPLQHEPTAHLLRLLDHLHARVWQSPSTRGKGTEGLSWKGREAREGGSANEFINK